MRALTGLILAGAAFAAAPSAALADDTPMCPPAPFDAALHAQLDPYLQSVMTAVTPGSGVPSQRIGGQAGEAAKAALGSQLVWSAVDDARHGWSVIFSPGPHDATSARAAIRASLATMLPAAEVDYLDSTLTLLPTPYSRPQLEAVVLQLLPQVSPTSIIGSFSLGCSWSDGVRVEVGIADPETPELRAQAEALVAGFGDLVRLRFGVGRPEPVTPAPGLVPVAPQVTPPARKPAAAKLRDHVRLPSTARCLRGKTLTVKPGTDVRKLRLAAGARKVVAGSGKAAKLKLMGRRTKVAVTVTLKDGGAVTQTFTYRRCA